MGNKKFEEKLTEEFKKQILKMIDEDDKLKKQVESEENHIFARILKGQLKFVNASDVD